MKLLDSNSKMLMRIVLLSYFNGCKSRNTFLGAIKSFFSSLMHRIHINKSMKGIIFYNSVERRDHIALFQEIVNSCKEPFTCIDLEFRNAINFYSVIFLFKAKHHLLDIKKILSQYIGNEAGRTNSIILYIYLQLVKFYTYSHDLSQEDFSNVKSLVVLSDVLFNELCLINVVNNLNISSVTCQHGISIPYDRIRNIDQLNYFGVSTKYALIWGNSTFSQFRRYSKECHCIICGNPVIKYNNSNNVGNYISVVCDTPIFKKYNQKMITITEKVAKKIKTKVLIRIHPNDSPSSYVFDDSVCQLSNETDYSYLIITHTSTMLFTFLATGRKVLRYQTDIPCLIDDKTIEFTDEESLEACISHLDTINFSILSKMHICCIGADSKRQYENFFDTYYN